MTEAFGKNTFYYITAIILFILLKIIYIYADTRDIIILLKPVDTLIQFTTNASSTFIPEKGYYFSKVEILIDKSCSGFNFMLLCFLMLFFSALKYFNRHFWKIMLLILTFVGSFFLTILVNTSRIIVSIKVHAMMEYFPMIVGKNILHQSIGIIIYLTFLILFYNLFNKLLKKNYPNEKLT
ncbi:exosortase K [Bacteroidales bacterium OttesenSCG-928-M06]|nr:exosortase K [Bacteroidales bacterium OttesenSCG-928-M06]